MDQVIRKYEDASRTWQQTLDALLERIGTHFGRKEMQERARDYLHGLLRPVERKNGWQLAEATGHAVLCCLENWCRRQSERRSRQSTGVILTSCRIGWHSIMNFS